MGCTNQAGEDNRNVARMGLLLAGPARRGARRDGQPPVRVGPRGGQPGRAPGDVRRRRAGAGRRRGVDDPRAARDGEAGPLVPARQPGPARHDDRLALHQPAHGGAGLHRFDGRDGRERRGALRDRPQPSRTSSRSRATAARSRPRRRAASTRRSCPCRCPQPKGDPVTVHSDEGPRPDTTLERLARLRPVFREGGTVTAGNSSQINDGAACVVLATEERAARAGPRAAGAHRVQRRRRRRPLLHGRRARSPATRKALDRAGLDDRRHRPRGAERGLRRPGARLRRASSASTASG